MGRCRCLLWALCLFVSSSVFAESHDYDVLFEETIGRELVTGVKGQYGNTRFRTILVDGSVTTKGTETTTYLRNFFMELRTKTEYNLNPNLDLRIFLPVISSIEKSESKEVPRILSEAKYLESRPRLEVRYAAQNGLDLVLGTQGLYISSYERETRTSVSTSQEEYDPAFLSYPHFAVVKHSAGLDAGLSFELGAEDSRDVRKTNTIEAGTTTLRDKVFAARKVSIFFQKALGSSSLFAQFEAVEASGGGNRTDRGATIKEDYFVFQLASKIPVASNVSIDPTFIYKSLSYADNRNITLDTIPSMSLQVLANFELPIPIFAGIIGMRGSDSQSLTEFNADYKSTAVGGILGAGMSF